MTNFTKTRLNPGEEFPSETIVSGIAFKTKAVTLLLSILLLVLTANIDALASHFKGGQITYEYQGNGRYKITVRGYWRAFSGFNGFFALNYTGNPTINSALTQTSSRILPDGITEELVQETTVTWSTPGTYMVSTARDCCRIIGENFNQQYYQLSAAIKYDPANPSSSPQFFDIPIFNFRPNIPLSFNFNSVDPEGHTQSWSLSTPYDLGSNVYTNMPGLSVSSAGVVSWTSPASGLWLVNIKVEERINGQLTGAYVFRDFILNITTTGGVNPNPPAFTAVTPKTVTAGQPLTFNVSASDPEGGNVTLLAGGLPLSSLGATFKQNNTGKNVNGTFSWTPTAAHIGSYNIQFVATDNGNPTLSSSINVVITVNPVKTNQTITFPVITDKTLGDPDFNLNATASSGLAVSYSFTSTPANIISISGNVVKILGVGSVTVTASQAGNTTYNAATPVSRSFVIKSQGKQDQTITFAPIADKTEGDAPFNLIATASSGLPVSFSLSSVPAGIAKLEGNTITLLGGTGTVTVTASQAGNATYNAAANVVRSFAINGVSNQQAVTGFTLINADTDKDLRQLKEGDILNLIDLPTVNFNIRANTSPQMVGSVVLTLNGQTVTENNGPYTFAGNSGSDYRAMSLPAGQYTLTATPYSLPGGKGTAGKALTMNFTVLYQAVESFVLVDAMTNQDIMQVKEGDVINLADITTRKFNIRANTNVQPVGSVLFDLNGQKAIENNAPYTFAGNTGSNYRGIDLPVGDYTLTATPYSGYTPYRYQNGTGYRGKGLTVNFKVINQANMARLGFAANAGEAQVSVTARPNPFHEKTTVEFCSPAGGKASIGVYDSRGNFVASLFEGELTPGYLNAVELQAAGLSSGLYIIRISTQDKVLYHKVVLSK
jgi:hypothetical protein